MKQIMEPEINARIATAVIVDRFSGAIAESDAIIIPNELGLANPHTANVAIAELLNYSKAFIMVSSNVTKF